MNLKKYLSFSWKYFILIFIISFIYFIFLKLNLISSLTSSRLGIIHLIIIFIAGYHAIKAGFSLRQLPIIIFFSFLGLIWLIPFIALDYLNRLNVSLNYPLLTIVSLSNIAVNFIIYLAVAFLGAIITLTFFSSL